MLIQAAPFTVGDKVTIKGSYYYGSKSYLNNIIRTVISIKRRGVCASGWQICVDGPNYHKKGKGLKMDSGWFIKISSDDPKTKRENILEKISEGISRGDSDLQIDQSFQRHVTKADLVSCIRHLLISRDKASEPKAFESEKK